MRKVETHFDSEWQAACAATTGHFEMQRAIGRLVSWCPDSYPEVMIRPDGDTDMVAIYRKPDGTTGYVIGAVWHANPEEENGGHYGFHS